MYGVAKALMQSGHPQPVKEVLFNKLIQSLPKQQASGYDDLLGLCAEWGLTESNNNSENIFRHKMSESFLTAIATLDSTSFLNYFNPKMLISYLERSERIAAISFITLVLKIKRDVCSVNELELKNECRFIDVALGSVLRHSNYSNSGTFHLPDAALQNAAAQYIAVLKSWVVNAQMLDEEIIETIILWMLHASPFSPIYKELLHNCSSLINSVIRQEESNELDPKRVMMVMRLMFSVIAEKEHLYSEGGKEMLKGGGIGMLLECIPVQPYAPLAGDFLSSLSSESTDKERKITKTIKVLVRSGLTQHNAEWIIALLKRFGQLQRYSLLCCASSAITQYVFTQLYIPEVRAAALDLIEFIWLTQQHNPSSFHLMLNFVPHLLSWILSETEHSPSTTEALSQQTILKINSQIQNLHKLRSEITKEAIEPIPQTDNTTVQRIVRLVFVLMRHHTGHPQLYLPLLTALSNFPQPTEEEKKSLLEKYSLFSSSANLDDSCFDYSVKYCNNRAAFGKLGLNNLGNTCYMNSFLQILFFSDPFRSLVLSAPASASSLLYELQRLFGFMLLSQRPSISPSSLLKVLPSFYRSGYQQDANEFGKYLLDKLESELSPKDKKKLSEIFEGMLEHSITCTICKNKSLTQEVFLDLSLPFSTVNNQISLEQILENYFSVEELKESNQYYCENCKSKTDAKRQISVKKLPSHLMLTLCRFDYDIATKSRIKILKPVQVPLWLKLPTPSSEESFFLYGMIMHSGTSAESGHYYSAAIPSSTPSSSVITESERYFMLNDSNVSKISFSSLNNISTSFKTDVPYILFYRKVEPQSESVNSSIYTQDEIPQQFLQEVLADNNRYLLEKEKSVERKKQQVGFSSFAPSKRFNDDFDPNGNGNGFGGCNTSGLGFGNKFIC